MGPPWRAGFLLAALLAPAAQQEKDAADQITKAVQAHFTKYDPARQAEVAKELLDSWKSLPDSGDIRKEGLRRTVAHIEIATHLFRSNEPPAPDRFHVRAYDLVPRRMRNYAANAALFPKRTAEERARILEQIDALFRHALAEFLPCAKDDKSERVVRNRLDEMRQEFARGADDPFTGYDKPLDETQYKDLLGRISKAAAGVTKMTYDKESPPFTDLGLSSRDARVFPVAIQAMYEISRAHDPVRTEIHDESQALLVEVKTDLAEQRKKAREGGEPK
jgi:hypothetical protein